MRWMAPIFLLILAACVSPEEIAAQDDAKCRELGFVPGTDAYGQCRLMVEMIRKQDEAIGIGLIGLGSQMQMNNQMQMQNMQRSVYGTR